MLIKAAKAPVGEDGFEICFDSANTSGSDAMFHNHKLPLRILGPREIFKVARPPRVHAILIISSGMFALAAFTRALGGRRRCSRDWNMMFRYVTRERRRRKVVVDLKRLWLARVQPRWGLELDSGPWLGLKITKKDRKLNLKVGERLLINLIRPTLK